MTAPLIAQGLMALVILMFFISAISLSYKIEKRSQPARNPNAPPAHTNIFGHALNMGVAKDPETQRLRRAMNIRLTMAAIVFVGFAILILTA